MRHTLLLLLALLGLLVPARADADDEQLTSEIQARLTSYLGAFNENDAERVAGFWAEDAVSLNEETGERTVGRDALRDGFRQFFAEYPGARLTGSVDHARLVGDTVSILEGRVTLFTPDAEPVDSAFTAVMVKQGDQWLLESSNERELPSPESPAEALAGLEWLVGDWRDQTDAAQVNTTVRWSANNAFLVRSYSADLGEGESLQGTQVIGWDPSTKQIRVWYFNSDGSFGEGAVTQSGAEWLVRLKQVLPTGELATVTQVIQRVDDDTFTVEKIGQTSGGSPLPSTPPVTVVRVAGEANESAAGATP